MTTLEHITNIETKNRISVSHIRKNLNNKRDVYTSRRFMNSLCELVEFLFKKGLTENETSFIMQECGVNVQDRYMAIVKIQNGFDYDTERRNMIWYKYQSNSLKN